MSDYTVLTFQNAGKYPVREIRRFMNDQWDSYSLNEKDDYLELVIHELTLSESVRILNALKKRFGFRFYVEYGVY